MDMSSLHMLYTGTTFINLVSQDTPSFLSLLGCVLTFIVGNTLSLYLTILLNEQKKMLEKSIK